MKRKFLVCAVAALLTALIVIGTVPIVSAVQLAVLGEVQTLIDGIVAYQCRQADASSEQEWIDGALTETAGTTAEWYIFALAQSGGEYDFSRYQTALTAYLQANEIYSASSRQKYALVLAATGSHDPYIAVIAEDAVGKQGIMSVVYGLHLIHNGYSGSSVTADSLVQQLLSMQLDDGGWALTGTVSDVDVTAMTVQALAYHYVSDTAVRAAVDNALSLLSSRQLENGDFSSYGVPNAESTAQVIVALCALGIDGESDDRFIKNGHTPLDGIRRYVLADGSVCHTRGGESHHNATAQAFYAMIAYQRMSEGKSGLHILDRAVPSHDTSPTTTAVLTTPTTSPVSQSPNGGYKPIATIVVVVLAGGVCGVLCLLKKANKKNMIAVFLLMAVAIALVWITTFRRADDYYDESLPQKENAVGTVTLSIFCDTLVDKSDAAHIPADGVVLPPTVFAIEDGDTVYDILVEAVRAGGIHMENSGQNGMVYIAGIHNIYELDFGELSGWIYFVNGEEAAVGCDAYVLADGDRIEWRYTCELGNDLK